MNAHTTIRRLHVEVECLDDEDTMSAPGAGLFENAWQAVESVTSEFDAAGFEIRLVRLPISQASARPVAAVFIDGIPAEEWLGDAAASYGYPSILAIAHALRAAAGLVPGGPVRTVYEMRDSVDVTFVTSEASS